MRFYPIVMTSPVLDLESDLWVFGYGSLMWRPGFVFEEQQLALVRGYHRALCIYSHIHRGTPEHPGLVLGLDRGGSCKGIAFRISADRVVETLAYLRKREQQNMVYREVTLQAMVAGAKNVPALAYVANRGHPQYAGDLALPDLERLVRQGHGVSGANPEYVVNTYQHMAGLGITDAKLAALTRRFGAGAASL